MGNSDGRVVVFFVYHQLFTIPLHAAVRAMAAACRCPRGQQPIFPAFKTNPVPNRVRILAGLPDLLPPMTARQKKRRGRTRTQTKEKKKKGQNPPRPLYSPNSIPSSAWAGPPSSVAVTSASPTSSSPWVAGASLSGASGASAPFSLR